MILSPLLIAIVCLPLLALLGWLLWRVHATGRQATRIAFIERELGKHSDHSQSLGTVVKRHIQQSLEARQQVRLVQRQLDALRSQIVQGGACDAAIARVRKGKDIKSLVNRGDLSSAEAHLIRLVHSAPNPAAQGSTGQPN